MFKLITTVHRNFRNVPRTSLATDKGYAYAISTTTGNLAVAGASTDQNQEIYISKETLASGSTPVNCLIVSRGDEFLVDTVNNTAATQVGQRCVLNSTGDKLNNTGTDATAGVFEIISIVGAAADKQVIAKRV